MNTDLERELRATFNEMADETTQADLAAPALRRGQRIRLRRNTATTAAAVAVAVALVAQVTVLRDHSTDWTIGPASHGSPGSASPSGASATATGPRPVPALADGPVNLPGGWLVASSPGRSGTWVYDRDRRQYREVPYAGAAPAPTGALVAVRRSSDQHMGILNMRTDKVQWVSGPANVVGTAKWSPDGSRLVYPGAGTVDTALRLVVVDAANVRATTLPPNIECVENCAPFWLANGTEIAMPRMDDPFGGLRVFSAADGTPRPDIAVAGTVGSPHAWSPDGRYVVARAPVDGAVDTFVVEVSTGRHVSRLRRVHPNAVYWAGTDRLLAITSYGIAELALDGSQVSVFPLPAEFAPDEPTQTVLGRQ